MRFIGKFIVRGLLGRGGMAAVYKVKVPGLGRLAALKLLAPREELLALLGEAELKRRFVEEARLMASLQHPNLVSVWDLDDNNARPFYLMDYHCRDLARLIGEGERLEDPTRALQPDRALDIIGQCLKGLARLHAAGVVHRDIKPGNLLISAHNRIKICDFGLAKTARSDFTEPPNLLVGSPYYTAPEQEKDPAAADRRSDLYSVGVMLHRLLSGWLEFDSRADGTAEPDLLHPDWRDFVKRAMESDPAKRFQSAAKMLAALEELEAGWRRYKYDACKLSEPEPAGGEPHIRAQRRSQALKVASAQARQTFGLDDLWRPRALSSADFQVPKPDLIKDAASSLIWERSGSPYPLTWAQALRRIYDLNETSFMGRNDWRMPTVDELISLVSPSPEGKGFCQASPFDPRQDWLWSADRRSFTSAWLVSLSEGFVAWQDNSCLFHLRAVASGG